MRFSRKSINKTISKIDRYFTWDIRSMGKGYFSANDFENHKYVDFHPFVNGSYWFYYDNNGHIYHKVIKTYRDLNELNKLIKVIF